MNARHRSSSTSWNVTPNLSLMPANRNCDDISIHKNSPEENSRKSSDHTRWNGTPQKSAINLIAEIVSIPILQRTKRMQELVWLDVFLVSLGFNLASLDAPDSWTTTPSLWRISCTTKSDQVPLIMPPTPGTLFAYLLIPTSVSLYLGVHSNEEKWKCFFFDCHILCARFSAFTVSASQSANRVGFALFEVLCERKIFGTQSFNDGNRQRKSTWEIESENSIQCIFKRPGRWRSLPVRE
jgi:hypothetical protein